MRITDFFVTQISAVFERCFCLNKKLIEKRKTVSVLDSQTEIMIQQLEVLAGYVERAKGSKQPMNIAELEDSAIKEFVQKQWSRKYRLWRIVL